jgi:SAM-dependent MidA family methyltransferase
LAARQREHLAAWGDRVQWVQELPERMEAVVVGNEVLDAMPVKLLARLKGAWHERGVALHEGQLVWADRPTPARPSCEVEGAHDYLTEIHTQAEAFVASVAERLLASERGGAAFFLDYGFPEAEYFHPQRHMGTVMCHQAHQSDMNPLVAVGLKDITAHVNFTGIALAGQDQGLHVLGYTSQARFLLNLGLAEAMAQAEQVAIEHLGPSGEPDEHRVTAVLKRPQLHAGLQGESAGGRQAAQLFQGGLGRIALQVLQRAEAPDIALA